MVVPLVVCQIRQTTMAPEAPTVSAHVQMTRLPWWKKYPLPPVYWRWDEEGGGNYSLTMARSGPPLPWFLLAERLDQRGLHRGFSTTTRNLRPLGFEPWCVSMEPYPALSAYRCTSAPYHLGKSLVCSASGHVGNFKGVSETGLSVSRAWGSSDSRIYSVSATEVAATCR